MYNKIFNTETNNFVNIDTKEGKLILRKYIDYINRIVWKKDSSTRMA